MNKSSVCILDYGSGNVRSVYNVFRNLGHQVVISNSKKTIREASHLVLPGVGSFRSAMSKINERLPIEILEREVLNNGKPFLGICVGMQVLAEVGNEFEQCNGLGWISGSVQKLNTNGLSLPHVGWNDISIVCDHPIFHNLKDHRDLYFVHSYCFVPTFGADVLANTDYGDKFVSIVCKENVLGFQFHPEKSQRAGQLLLNNFVTKL